jgi:formylglycine-generating enzyme required for sulfatase activity
VRIWRTQLRFPLASRARGDRGADIQYALAVGGLAILLAALLFVPWSTGQERDSGSPCVPSTQHLQALAERLNRFWGVHADLLVCDGDRVKFGTHATPSGVYFVPKQAREIGLDDEVGTAYIIAHEWGHQVQFQRLRIESAFSLNSQREFQADCLAGYFIGATFPYSPDTERRLMGAVEAVGNDRTLHAQQLSGPLANVRASYVREGYRDGRQRRVVGCKITNSIQPNLDVGSSDPAKAPPAPEDRAEMIPVPAGEFWMGGDAYRWEAPRHRVYLDAFSIDKHEVTNVSYRQFMKATGHAAPSYWSDAKWNGALQPVVGVSWLDADAYCQWAGRRLPTEAEWEKAARGTDAREYPWGNQWDSGRANSLESRVDRTVAVGSYPSGVSPYGVHDMAGNVWEWVADWFDSDYYSRSPDRDPQGPSSGSLKVLRGGSWLNGPTSLRAANRSSRTPVDPSRYIGFRCAKGPS